MPGLFSFPGEVYYTTPSQYAGNNMAAFNQPMYTSRGDAERAAKAAAVNANGNISPYAATGGSSVSGNIDNFTDIQALADKINQLNVTAQQKANAARIPGATGLEEKSSANISAALSGQLPQDVLAQLAQGAAERGVATGQPGGDQVNSAYLRALGLNSLKMQDTGQGWLTNAYARNPGAATFDVSNLLITPYQREQLNQAAKELELRQQALQQANNQMALNYVLGNKQANLGYYSDMAKVNAATGAGAGKTTGAGDAVGSNVPYDGRWWNLPNYSPTMGDMLGYYNYKG